MSAHTIDVTILTCQKYLNPKVITTYEQNILDERKLITQALEDLGLKVHCKQRHNLLTPMTSYSGI